MLGDALDDIFDGGLVLEVEAEGLALESCLVNDLSGICLKTRERAHDVGVDFLDLPDSARILEMGDCFLLDCEDNAVRALESNGGSSSVDSFESVLNLEELAVRSKDGDGFVVSGHLLTK